MDFFNQDDGKYAFSLGSRDQEAMVAKGGNVIRMILAVDGCENLDPSHAATGTAVGVWVNTVKYPFSELYPVDCDLNAEEGGATYSTMIDGKREDASIIGPSLDPDRLLATYSTPWQVGVQVDLRKMTVKIIE